MLSKSLFLCSLVQSTFAHDVRSLADAYGSVSSATARVTAPTVTHCNFPFEIVLVQDTTSSLDDDVESMIEGVQQLERLTQIHPDTRVAIVTFKDKPIWTLGIDSDYCALLVQPFTRDMDRLSWNYQLLLRDTYGGGDMPESSFHALLQAANARVVGWTETEASAQIAKLIIVMTDAAPHFADDGYGENAGLDLPAFEVPDPNINDLNTGCSDMYYPSPDQVAQALSDRNAYAAFFVSGGDYDPKVGGSWEWFNNYLGQNQVFYQEMASDSSDFYEQLDKVVRWIEREACGGEATPLPTEPPASTTLEQTGVESAAATSGPSGETEEVVTGSTNLAQLCGAQSRCPNFGCTCCCAASADGCPASQKAMRFISAVPLY
eukprot:Blabericola_migrator_1__3627@NODE_2085_length_3295_cov_588_127323_g1322_i0_p1_GENE_NODE_2085_length_3295_cov_588_127323_g1322_i0NODE_2085_length_3295_cov_588_127323_g1322_i0_p1_ORF_typecomplete_len377_score79_84Integrin_beta/PF00362_18/3_1e24VWA/PF00092_28/1_9e06VWA_2/PF13519_6/0_017VWA_2/PF13519_6/1_8e04AHSA1/PF08327_11/0_15RNA_helicase/PF00910_22/0_27_NODE_2085_length_3295_cov_588_127323_g1322_i02871417